MGKRRKGKCVRNNRQVGIDEPESVKRAPHSFVIHRGVIGKSLRALVRDFRKVMEPYTASRLKVRKKNSLKDFVAVSGLLHVSHISMFTITEISPYLRVARLPQGPTLTFRLHEYTLARDVISSQRKQYTHSKCFTESPLLIMNGFGADTNHLKLISTMFQSMFPTINITKVKLNDVKRCVLLNYDAESKCIDFRQYVIRVTPAGISKGIKKIALGKIPNLSKYEDMSDFIHKQDLLSDMSDVEDETKDVLLPQKISSKKGNIVNNTSAIRLTEIGPRMKMQLVKIECGLMNGEVMFHEYIQKTPEEVEKMNGERREKRRLKEKRKREQELNVKKKEQLKTELKEKSLQGMKSKTDKLKYEEEMKSQEITDDEHELKIESQDEEIERSIDDSENELSGCDNEDLQGDDSEDSIVDDLETGEDDTDSDDFEDNDSETGDENNLETGEEDEKKSDTDLGKLNKDPSKKVGVQKALTSKVEELKPCLKKNLPAVESKIKSNSIKNNQLSDGEDDNSVEESEDNEDDNEGTENESEDSAENMENDLDKQDEEVEEIENNTSPIKKPTEQRIIKIPKMTYHSNSESEEDEEVKICQKIKTQWVQKKNVENDNDKVEDPGGEMEVEDDDDAEWYRKEVGQEPEPELFGGSSSGFKRRGSFGRRGGPWKRGRSDNRSQGFRRGRGLGDIFDRDRTYNGEKRDFGDDSSDKRGFSDQRRESRGGFGDRRGSRGGFGDRRGSRGCFGDRRGSRGGFGDRRGSRGGFGGRRGSRGGFGDRRGSRGGFGDRRGSRGGFGDRRGSRGGFGDIRGSRGGFGNRRGSRGGFGDNRGARGGFGAGRSFRGGGRRRGGTRVTDSVRHS